LGATTPSFDLETPIDFRFPTEHIDRALIDKVIPDFKGEIQQIPPVFSAVKIDGKRAYNYARNGNEVELKPKLLVIDEIEVLHFENTKLVIRVVCSKGTYIRALARDIGKALGSGAHLTALQRTKIGNIGLSDCKDVNILLQEIENELLNSKIN
jgi:tRNA pseudouridine55 synthase